MPRPPISKTFTYNGTPEPLLRSDPFNTLDRFMIQTQRFYNSPDTGTYKYTSVSDKKIPRNSGEGKGAGTGQIIDSDNTI